MFAYPLRTAALAAAALVGLSACTPYGYSGVSVGVGNAGYYDPYYDGYGYGGYSRYGSGYGYGYQPYYGWYDGFYYPGTGYYIYDIYRRPIRWSDRHRRYWEQRRERSLLSGFRQAATNWSDFDRGPAGATTSGTTTQRVRRIEQGDGQPVTIRRRDERPATIQRSLVQRAERAERKSVQSEARAQARAERVERVRSSSTDEDRGSRGQHRGRGDKED